MIHIISKLAPIPFFPIGLTLLLLLTGLIFLRFSKKTPGYCFCISAGLVLLLLSTPVFSNSLLGLLEKPYPQPTTFPEASAIVILGGAGVFKEHPRNYVETNEFADRIFHGARLFKQGFAPLLIVTGGRLSMFGQQSGSEARNYFELLTELFCIDSAAILLEEESKNTRDHAPRIARILDSLGLERKIIVVTTAFHMPRSIAVFEKAQLNPIAAPTDYRSSHPGSFAVMKLVPNTSGLHNSYLAMHEFYGMIAYRILGWI